MWSREVDGRTLHFRLIGINNQNFLMSDEETGSWWQQITGECILGPLKGKRLNRIYSEEVTVATWREEHPGSTIVKFSDKYKDRYFPSDWEKTTDKVPTVTPRDPDSKLDPRDLVVGVELKDRSYAYPLRLLREQSPVQHQIGGEPVLVVLNSDGKSVRTFVRRLDGEAVEFYRKPGDDGRLLLIDATSGSTWDFSGAAIEGPLTGRKLEPIQNITEYWFDWKKYHPDTGTYLAGESLRR